jgi:hypothetical protein
MKVPICRFWCESGMTGRHLEKSNSTRKFEVVGGNFEKIMRNGYIYCRLIEREKKSSQNDFPICST